MRDAMTAWDVAHITTPAGGIGTGAVAAGAADESHATHRQRLIEHIDRVHLPPRGLEDVRGLLQSACWYLDDSANTWAGMMSHWAVPSYADTMAELSRLMCDVQPDAPGVCPLGTAKVAAPAATTGNGGSISASAAAAVLVAAGVRAYTGYSSPGSPSSSSSPSAPLWPPVLSSPSPVWGGEASAWSEEIDALNLECRAWPRAAVVADALSSESLAYDRYARSLGRNRYGTARSRLTPRLCNTPRAGLPPGSLRSLCTNAS